MQSSDEIAQRIIVLRRALGVTQERLASLIGVTFSTVSRWENGHVRPSRLAWSQLRLLARENGLDPTSPGWSPLPSAETAPAAERLA